MKKFKSFHCGIDPTDAHAIPKTAVEWANEWIEENPKVECIEFRHSLDKDGHDVICVMYEVVGEIVVMDRLFHEYSMSTAYKCPKCGYTKFLYGNITLFDPTCPSCKKGKPS